MCEADPWPWEMTVSNDSICNILVFSHAEWVHLVNSAFFSFFQAAVFFLFETGSFHNTCFNHVPVV